MSTSKDQRGRFILEASSGAHGDVAKRLAAEWCVLAEKLQTMVPRSVAQRAVNHASLGTPGSLAEATLMLDRAAMQKDTQ